MSELENIKNPNDLKNKKIKQIKNICQDIRDLIIKTSLTNDIHLSSNLGIVELSTMILKVFDINNDKILYDTGHQTYVHKILTGRMEQFATIRQEGSLSGLMDMLESKYDHYSPGHSGNILSVASGMYQVIAQANKHPKKKQYFNPYNIVAVVGDSAFANGLNFEALNDISFKQEPIIIILNDNGMSISKSVGALSKSITKIKGWQWFHFIERICRVVFKYNKFYYFLLNTFNFIQNRIVGKNLFENLGYYYIGPIDGHDVKQLEKFLKRARWFAKQGPVILHVKTKKGKGCGDAELDICGDYHSITKNKNQTYGMMMTDHLLSMMKQHDDIWVINPAMSNASKCEKILQAYPDRYIDVGISEEHAIAKAGGMNLVKLKPYIYMYSTFLQRTYDQLLHDITRLNLNCTILLDRCDLSGGDGSTHHGIYDIGFLKTIHNALICSGRNINQNKQLLELSYKYNDGLFVIRYPKSDFDQSMNDIKYSIKLGQWEYFLKHNSKVVIISYGPYINKIIKQFYLNNKIDVINAIFITKYDVKQVDKILKKYQHIIIYERIFNDGLSQDFYKRSNEIKSNSKIHSMHYQKIVSHGSNECLDKRNNMDIENISTLVNLLMK